MIRTDDARPVVAYPVLNIFSLLKSIVLIIWLFGKIQLILPDIYTKK